MAYEADGAVFPPTLKTRSSQGQHYLMFQSYESKNAIEAGAPKTNICLYIPSNSLTTTYGANYDGMESGALYAAAGGAIQDAFQRGSVAAIGEALGKVGIQGGAVGAGVRALSKIAPSATGMLSAGMGVAVNNHMALVYKGPNAFRSHTFNFMLFPKNANEAKIIRTICEDFKNSMLPRMVGAGASNGRLNSPFFKSPRQWSIKVFTNGTENQYIKMFPKVKDAQGNLRPMRHVVTSMNLNHDPQSIVSFHDDGSPVQTNLSLTFQELEFVTSTDPVDATFERGIGKVSEQMAQASRREQEVLDREVRNAESATAAGMGGDPSLFYD